jgi:hypothetical protein
MFKACHAPRQGLRPTLVCAALLALFAPGAAQAIVLGTSSALERHMVRITIGGARHCSGVAIARSAIVTAAHCASRGASILGGGRQLRVAAVTRSAVLDDGRRVSVSGDAAIVKLSAPLPAAISPVPISEGSAESFTIAGFGTADERLRGAFGTLREARLVAAEPRALVDPNRQGAIGASACFGDSGGAVLRGSALVGVITRAAHPSPRIACGYLTRWAPVTASGNAATPAQIAGLAGVPVETPRQRKLRRVRAKPAMPEPRTQSPGSSITSP